MKKEVSFISNTTSELLKEHLPKRLQARWNYLRHQLYSLATKHTKQGLIETLIELRENYTAMPTLSAITQFTGFDVAIHRIMRWEWDEKERGDLLIDAETIGKIGAELMVIHAIGESVKNGLFIINKDSTLVESDMGKIHFETVNSYNIEVTGSRMDIARKRFNNERQSKYVRKLDPTYQIPSVRKLYWDNTILMILRSPLTFYRAMKSLTEEEQKRLIDFHTKLMNHTENRKSGVKKVRLPKNAKICKVLEKLLPENNPTDRRPKYIIGWESNSSDDDKRTFNIGIGGLTMFIIFLNGFIQDQLNDKARRAEMAVRDIIERSGFWEVVETNKEITSEEGEALTEIDIVARSKNPVDGKEHAWVHCEVKDFSYWQGWIFGQSIEIRRKYFEKAVSKLEVKEEFIKKKHNCTNLRSIIVTSVPEVFHEVNGVELVYLTNLFRKLSEFENRPYTGKKKTKGGNFFLRYYDRFIKDNRQAKDLRRRHQELIEKKKQLRQELEQIKQNHDERRAAIEQQESNLQTIKISEKLARKRLIRDKGDRHYILEDDLKKIRREIELKKTEVKRMKRLLNKHRKEYLERKSAYESLEKKIKQLEQQIDRLLEPRGI